MFPGLDEIDWGGLEHAYGPARDVPGLIRSLARGEAEAKKAIHAFFGNIYHQGTVYTASAPAVPFLAEALEYVAPEQQASLLGLLAALAEGHGYYDVHRHLPFAKKAMEESWVDDPDATLDAERSIVRDTALAVFAQWEAIERCLDASDPAARLGALYTLAVLGRNDASGAASPDQAAAYLDVRPPGTAKGSWAARLRTRLERILPTTKEPIERAACLRALSWIGAHDHSALDLDQLAAHGPFEQFVIVLHCASRDLATSTELPDRYAALIASLAGKVDELGEIPKSGLWPWDESVTESLLALFARLPERALDEFGADCARLVANAHVHVFDFEIILALILGGTAPRIPDGPCTLSPGRREIAKAFLTRPREADPWWFWEKTNGNASNACRAFNVPHDRKAWLKWLGLPQNI